MPTGFEIVRVVEGCWFDAEGYERTPPLGGGVPAASGYYVRFREPSDPTRAWSGDTPGIGPFASEGVAGKVAHSQLAMDRSAPPCNERR